jgi:signal transduction histidine kinase
MSALPGRPGDDRIAGEQAALRRVATLVARAALAGEVFTAVTEEAGRLLGADFAVTARYDPDGARTVVATWSSTGRPAFSLGNRIRLGGRNVPTLIFQTHRAARIDDHDHASGPIADAVRAFGVRASVGVPVSVEGALWGLLAVGSSTGPLPASTEAKLAGFTELAATAIANAQARVELRGFGEEQAALRRVATLVASGTPSEEVLAAITEEAGRLLDTDHATMKRYGPDDTVRVVATWSSVGAGYPVGAGASLGGWNVPTMIFQTRQPARIDDLAGASGPVARLPRELGFRASVGVPVSVEGQLWGLMMVESRTGPLPAGTEKRLAGFTELAATAIANAQARVELRGFADEQAALRRVATLVADAAPPAQVFAAVTEEAARLLHADYATINRYGPDGTARVVGGWASTGLVLPAGSGWSTGGRNVNTLVFQTGRAARIDDYGHASGPAAEDARGLGLRAGVGVPVSAEGRPWGCMFVASKREPLPAGTEAQLAGFTKLAGTAIANAEAQAALSASRARIVATADATRRRIERNLHDGAQQRLVSIALNLRAAQAAAAPGAGDQLGQLAAGLDGVLDDLREIARGLHPAILADGGLPPALKTLARRSPIPVDLDIQVDRRLPDPVEMAAYYTVSEALTNAAKYAHATSTEIQATARDDVLHVRVRDNGRGGADFARGTGLLGLKDRAEALGGHLLLHSPPGAGTTLEITLPLDQPGGPEPSPGAQSSPEMPAG